MLATPRTLFMSKRSAALEYDETKRDINVMLSRKSLALLDAIAKRVGTSRSDAIERIARGYDMPPVVVQPIDEPEEQARINVTLTPTVISLLKGWAQDLGSNRSDMIERLIIGQYRIENGSPIHYQGQLKLQVL